MKPIRWRSLPLLYLGCQLEIKGYLYKQLKSLLSFPGSSLSGISLRRFLLFPGLSRLSWLSGFSGFPFFFGFFSFLGITSLLFLFFGLSWSSFFSSSSAFFFMIFLLNFGFYFKVCLQFLSNIFSESGFQHVVSFDINSNFVEFDFRFLGDPIQSSLSLFLLNFEGDTFDWTLLNSLDEMGSESCDFVSQSLGGDFSNLGQDSFVDMEIRSQLLVVFFEKHLSCSFDCFSSDSAHAWISSQWQIIFILFNAINCILFYLISHPCLKVPALNTSLFLRRYNRLIQMKVFRVWIDVLRDYNWDLFVFRYIPFIKMQANQCSKNCKVEFLSELWVCTSQGCSQPLIRCKDCFGKLHVSEEGGKLKTHSHKSFDESSVFRHFCYFIKLYEIIVSRCKRAYGKVNPNLEYLSWQIFSTSDFIKKFQSPAALGQFYVLKQLFYKRPAQFAASPSAELYTSLTLFSEKMFNTNRSLLLQPSEQQQLLSYYYNQVSDSNSEPLELFIATEQIAFSAYCEELREKNGVFDIESYVKSRKDSTGVNTVYFSTIFERFLDEKYSERPEDQQIFTTSEYTNYVWQNLHILSLNPSIISYLDVWVDTYKQYSAFMLGKQLQPTLLAFRMWRNHVPSIAESSKSQDRYFLDNFVLSYIEFVINRTLYTVGNADVKGWKEYMVYLKDYVGVSKIKGDQFVDIGKYSTYFEFRVKSQDFVNYIQKSQQISFNKVYCIDYLNLTFFEGSQINKKNYIKFVATKQEEANAKSNKLSEQIQVLQKQLEQEEGEKFYRVIYNDYVRECLKDKLTPSKEKYSQFKADVLERYDEEEIKLSNDRLLLEEKQRLQKSLTGNQEKKAEQSKESKGKVIHGIDVAEEELAEKVNSESDQEAPVVEDCQCCGGKPEDCDKEECQMMGYCVTCSL